MDTIGAQHNGSLWVATHAGVILHLDPATGSVKQTAKLPAHILSDLRDSSGRLFFLTAHGIYLSQPLAPGKGSVLPGQRDGVQSTPPHRIPAADALAGQSTPVLAACESPDGADWFTAGNRLLRLKDGQWSMPVLEGMTKQEGNLRAVSCARDGSLWLVGAGGDTWRLTPAGSRLQAWKLEPPPELRSSDTLTILVDRRGWVWVGTDQGLLVWNGQSWRHLTQECGLIWTTSIRA